MASLYRVAISGTFILHLALLLVAKLTHASSIPVTCGSTIKLQHVNTKIRLHSHEVAYSRGSQQQSVTGFVNGDDGNSYWVIHGSPDAPCVPGTTLRKGTKLRLQHTSTRKWLHSHHYYSPLSNNQEVSAFGGDSMTDGGDVWTVEWDGKSKVWKQDTKVRIKHVDTGFYLFSHEVKYGNPIGGQQEVAAKQQKDKSAEWLAAEGVYYPQENGSTPKEEL